MMIHEANEIMAKACNIELLPSFGATLHIKQEKERDSYCHWTVWSIERAECREIIRNWWINRKLGVTVTFLPYVVLYSWAGGGIVDKDEIGCIIQIAERLMKNETT